MLDDKDTFGRIGNSYIESAADQVRYWLVEKWTPIYAFESGKNPFAEVKAYLKWFGPCIDHELVTIGVLPYSCTRPFNWEACKNHA
jgi:hypothetical protein